MSGNTSMNTTSNHHKHTTARSISFKNKASLLLLAVINVSLVSSCSQTKNTEDTANTPEPPKVVSYLVLGNKDSNVLAGNDQNGATTDISKTPISNNKNLPIRKLSGQVVAAESTNLSFEASGKIKQLLVKTGDRVKKGQVLAVLDDTTYRLQQYQSEAQLKQALTQQKQAQANVKRREALVEMGAVSKAEIDAVNFDLQNANESLQVALAAVELSKKQSFDTKLRAPFNGSITQQMGEVGQMASPSIAVFSMASNTAPEVEFNVPESLLSSISVGKTLPVSFAALPKLKGIVGRITQVSTQGVSGTFPIRLRLQNATPQIQSGMTAEVSLPITLPAFAKTNQTAITSPDKQNTSSNTSTNVKGFAVPPSAVGAGNNPQNPQAGFVYKIVTNSQSQKSTNNAKQLGTTEKVNVTITGIANNTLYIHGNLNNGDILVRTGVSMLDDKQAVELMNTGARRINP